MTNKQMPDQYSAPSEYMPTYVELEREVKRQHAEIERLRAEVEGLQAENNVLCEALSAYIMFKNDARIIEGNFHWLPDGESVEEIIDVALQSTKEQP